MQKMSFTSKKVQSQRNSIGYIKGATLFFLGMSCVLFIARAFEIEPSVANAVQYINSIFLTIDGSNATPTRIALNGANGNGNFSGSITATTLSGTNIKGAIITGSTICLGTDGCRTTWPTGGTSVGGGESIWSTGAAGAVYYNGGNVGIGTGNPSANFHIYGLDPKILLEGDISAGDGNHNQIIFSDKAFPSSDSIIEYNSQDFEFSLKTLSNWPMIFGTNNIERMRITSDGKVGIGTNNPTAKLEVASGSAHIKMDVASGILSYVSFSTANTLSGFRVGQLNLFGSQYNFLFSDGLPLVLSTNGSLSMFFLSTGGNVGIGTDTPTEKLTVNGGIGIHGNGSNVGDFELYSNTTTNTKDGYIGLYHILGGTPWITTIVGTNGLFLSASGTNNPGIFISTGGRVGIGTTGPTETLHVNGGIRIGEDDEDQPQSSDPCLGKGGTIIYVSGQFFLCDGTIWHSLL